MRISKWGNSLAVRLPAKLVDALGVQEGDEVSVTADEEGRLVFGFNTPAAMSDEEFLARLGRFEGTFPADFKFDREEANERR